MTHQESRVEEIEAGRTVSIENTTKQQPLAITITLGTSRLDMNLVSGQILELVTGNSGGKVVLREGDPEGLLKIKPDTP